MHSDDKKEIFIKLRAAGNSFDKIVAKLNVSKPTLIKWSRQLAADIRNMKAIRMDAIREEYLITKEDRLERLKHSLKKVTDTLGERDLSDIPTIKLIELEETLIKKLNNELKITFEDKADFLENISLEGKVTWEA